MNCWASSLGDCGEGVSREHYVSNGIFDSESITAFGLPWCRDKPVTIGLKSAVAKILCGKHNSALSMFDGEAVKLSQFLETNVLEQPLIESTIHLQGTFLEKWALKTFLNLGYLAALHREQPGRLNPPEELIRYIFRNTPITEGVGLYFITDTINNDSYGTGLFGT